MSRHIATFALKTSSSVRHVADMSHHSETAEKVLQLLRNFLRILGQKREKLQIHLDVGDTNYRDFRQTVEREACTRDPITQSTCMTENKKKNEISQRQVVTYRDICLQIIAPRSPIYEGGPVLRSIKV